jgi:methionyl aminopeptidase
MIYIIKKMYKAQGEFIEINDNLRGVEPIFNNIEITQDYPDENDIIGSLELAASIHKNVRQYLQTQLKPGIKLIDIAKIIENKTYQLSNQPKSINKGIGFPASLSLNECAAHFHPIATNNIQLFKDDIIKIDFGTEVNGWIIDSAFTICFDYKFNKLINAVKEATYNGIKNIGVDVNIGDWGASISEVMESYEIKLNGQIIPIKTIKNLGGHNITKGNIHGGTFLPCIDMRHEMKNNKFKEGVYAVETFGSTGTNYAHETGDATLYRLNPQYKNSQNNFLNKLKNKFDTLPFTDRYIDNLNNYKSELDTLINNKYVHTYPPLCVYNGYTAQYEHTVYIDENKKIVFSAGEDY